MFHEVEKVITGYYIAINFHVALLYAFMLHYCRLLCCIVADFYATLLQDFILHYFRLLCCIITSFYAILLQAFDHLP